MKIKLALALLFFALHAFASDEAASQSDMTEIKLVVASMRFLEGLNDANFQNTSSDTIDTHIKRVRKYVDLKGFEFIEEKTNHVGEVTCGKCRRISCLDDHCWAYEVYKRVFCLDDHASKDPVLFLIVNLMFGVPCACCCAITTAQCGCFILSAPTRCCGSCGHFEQNTNLDTGARDSFLQTAAMVLMHDPKFPALIDEERAFITGLTEKVVKI